MLTTRMATTNHFIRNFLFTRLTNALVLILIIALTAITSPAQDTPKHDARYFVQQARQAYQAKDYPAMVENMKTALELRPTHQTYMYYLAVAYALTGDKAKALSLLSDGVSMGLTYNAERDPDLASLKDSAEFKDILSRIEKNRLHVGDGSAAFTVPEKDLIPEGLAYDPVKNVFFIGSVYKRKIVVTDQAGIPKDFSSPEDGLWSVMGMKVDAKRRLLWACTTAHPQMSNYNAADNGRSGIFKYDLNTGKLLKKYILPDKPGGHWLGDLVLNSGGDVFASDSLSPVIYFIDHRNDQLKVFVETPDLVNLQGMAFTQDERHLFIADYSLGLFLLDVDSKEYVHVSLPSHTTLLGIDGLYADGKDLIGVQNGIVPNRVVRIRLSADSRSVTALETIEVNHPLFDEPTLGVVVKKQFYGIANSQWGMIDKNGHITEPEKLKDPAILKIALVKD
jgi:hypothetical protein